MRTKAPLTDKAFRALAALRSTTATVQAIESDQGHWVARAREYGASWEDVAQALGVTKQAAWDKYRTEAEE